jgi:serine protein kinase
MTLDPKSTGGKSATAVADDKHAAFKGIAAKFDVQQFRKLNQQMTFAEYLDLTLKNPLVCLSAFQRLYDMILASGVERFRRFNRTHTRYNFFAKHPEFPIFGLEMAVEGFVRHIKGAAGFFGTEKRILLLHGPVGSSKSTAVRALKRGLEDYTTTDRGALYTFDWIDLPTKDDDLGPALELKKEAPCPMQDDPIKLIPRELRAAFQKRLNDSLTAMKLSDDKELDGELHRIFKVRLDGELNPHDKFFYKALLRRYDGDWGKVMEKHIRVRRVTLSESDRVGIGTFSPKDEKNQDSTELTGDVNYMKLGAYGVDSDPRAFNFDGEFEISNRGLLEMIEMLKLNEEFLYDLLGASQEKQIKPKKFPQVPIDLAIIGHTNNPEYQRLIKNDRMEALQDRTVRVDWPYVLRWDDEIAVLKQDYNSDKVRQHIAPHTIEVAALFAILTRLKVGKDAKLDPVKKAKLYNGMSLPGYTEDAIKELMDAEPNEGMDQGISARYVQNKISNALVSHHDYVNPFMVLHEIKEGLKTYSLIGNDENKRAMYEACVDAAKKELDEILKNEVRRALVMDDEAINRMFTNYLDNVFAYINKEKVKNEYTGEYEEPNERLMRSIEEKIDVPDQGVDDFRRSIAAYVGTLTRNKGKEALKWDSNPELARALELKLFEETKDTIKLSSLTKVTGVIDPEMQEKIDAIKTRLVKNYGYDDRSATDVLNYVGSIFARGDMVEDK